MSKRLLSTTKTSVEKLKADTPSASNFAHGAKRTLSNCYVVLSYLRLVCHRK